MNICFLGIAVFVVLLVIGFLISALARKGFVLLITMLVGSVAGTGTALGGNAVLWDKGDVRVSDTVVIASADTPDDILKNGYFMIEGNNGTMERRTFDDVQVYYSNETEQMLYVTYTKRFLCFETMDIKTALVFPESQKN